MLTFEQFQATRTECPDIAEAISADMGTEHKVPGNLYMGSLYIEAIQPWWPEEARAEGSWHLLIGRDEWISNDLEMLERKLFEFALSEGYEMGIDDLTKEYAVWNKAQGLNLGSADEHWHDESLTDEQRAWVRDFSARWDVAAERERRRR